MLLGSLPEKRGCEVSGQERHQPSWEMELIRCVSFGPRTTSITCYGARKKVTVGNWLCYNRWALDSVLHALDLVLLDHLTSSRYSSINMYIIFVYKSSNSTLLKHYSKLSGLSTRLTTPDLSIPTTHILINYIIIKIVVSLIITSRFHRYRRRTCDQSTILVVIQNQKNNGDTVAKWQGEKHALILHSDQLDTHVPAWWTNYNLLLYGRYHGKVIQRRIKTSESITQQECLRDMRLGEELET